jgi:putative addiction module antidote
MVEQELPKLTTRVRFSSPAPIVRAFAMTKLKPTAIGTSTGVVIPKEMLARLNVATGDVLYAVETPDGGYRLTRDPDFAARMDKADEIVRRYRNTLNALSTGPSAADS